MYVAATYPRSLQIALNCILVFWNIVNCYNGDMGAEIMMLNELFIIIFEREQILVTCVVLMLVDMRQTRLENTALKHINLSTHD